MNERKKSLSLFAWFTGAARKQHNTVKWVGSCASCRLPIEQLQTIFATVGQTYCRVCRGMMQAANTPYMQAVQDHYLEEQKRKKVLLPGGNYFSQM